MANSIDTGSWEFQQRIIRIGHNRDVKRYFSDVRADDSTVNGRAVLKSALLIRDTDSAIQVLNKQIYFRMGMEGARMSPTATMPEWWPQRVGAARPQLVIVFRPPGQKSSYQVTIPHYTGVKNPKIPSFRKGSHRGTLDLPDGSKLIINAASESEADRVIRALRRYIDPKYGRNVEPVFGRINNRFKEVTVQPIAADYFPVGQTGDRQWRIYF